MRLLTVKIILFFAVLTFVSKPFVGFGITNHFPSGNQTTNILLKAFTKRKQEFVEGSVFNILNIQKNLANPPSGLFLLFSSLLSILFPALLCNSGKITNGILADIHCGLFPPRHRYLLSGKLII
ncbi:MAG: hypothetical protein JWQ79_2762 [Mucilaginibacter sp.]|jgi:hypothetical protein|nr:hypothetical protein [Mucilaginibacter sp.]